MSSKEHEIKVCTGFYDKLGNNFKAQTVFMTLELIPYITVNSEIIARFINANNATC